MKLNINTKYEGDYLTAQEFNQLVSSINNYNIGELANVDSTVDNNIEDDSVLVKYAGEGKFTLKKLSEIVAPIIGLQRYVALQNDMISKNVAVSKGDKCILEFTFISQERYSSADKFVNTEERGLLEVSIKNSANADYTIVKQMYVNSAEKLKLDVTEYLTSNTNSVMLKCKGEVSEESTQALIYNVTVTSLGINADNFRWWIPINGDIVVPFMISGNISKKLFATITGADYNQSYEENLGTATYIETPYNYTIPRPEKDGVYTLTAYVTNSDETLVSKAISYNIMVVSTGSQNKYLIVNNLNTNIRNYAENTILDYSIYAGDASISDIVFTIDFDGKQVYLSNEDAAPTQTKNTFSYQAEIEYDLSDTFDLTLTIGDSTTSNLVQPITLKVDNSYSFSSVGGAVFYMNPKTRSNTQSNRKQIVNQMTGEEINATWNNFNWANDAWQTDESGNSMLRVLSRELLTIDYFPFSTESARIGKTIEIDYQVDNVIDFSIPVIRMCTDEDGYIGLKIMPDNVCLQSTSLKNNITQSINTDTGKRIRLSVVIMPTAYGNADFNLAIIYINGKKNREFAYASNDYFAQNSPIRIGSDAADVDVYGIRMYDQALTSQQVLKNYINWLSDMEEKERTALENDVLDTTGTEVDYNNTVDQYNVMVFDTDLPYFLDQSKKKGTLSVYFYEHPERNVSITKMEASGQGTSSKKYFRWNTKYKIKDDSVITYADGSTGSKSWAMVDDIPAATVFTAKKNFASSMQSHKMGSVNSIDMLYKELGFSNEAMQTEQYKDARITVYQMPFIMFTKSINDEGETVYRFEGEYTMGPDKGDENTFGFDTDLFPRMIAIEGSDNSPLPSLFRVPWSSRMQYNEDEEAFQYNGQNCWDFGGGDTANIDLWIPAYSLAYECSNRILPFNGTLEELNADVIKYRSSGYDYWIAKAGDVNQYNQYYFEASEQRFISAGINLKNQLAGYIDNIGSFSIVQLNELFINARIAKFRDEAPNYFDISDAIFHRNWVEVMAGTDQRAKNTYPYCFGDGCKWKWRFDDTDTIFDTDNQGQPLKKYSVEVTDNKIWNGQTSNFWNLIDLAFEDRIKNEMVSFLDAMETLGGLKVGDDYSKLFAFFKRFYLDSSQYFPATIVNADAKYSYETAKLNPDYTNDTDPMTQCLGDHYSAESAWISKRINYIMSKYSYGNFSANGNDTILVRAAGDLIDYHLTPAIDLYPNIANGTSIVRGKRTFAGDTTVMTIDLGGSADQQNIIQGASWYSSIGDWHDKNVKGAMTISGRRLQEIILGSKDDQITISIDSLDVKSNCKSLQKILLSNISTLKGNLDLSYCSNLREIYADGTSLSQIILPKGSLEHIEYPDTNQYLTLQNFPLLDYSNIILGNSAANINDIMITSCPLIEPIRVLSDIIDAQADQGDAHKLKRIRLTDFNETYSSEESRKLIENLAKITDGSYKGLDSSGIELQDSYPQLEGTITINGNYYNDDVDPLKQKFNKLEFILNGKPAIKFEDPEVLRVLTTEMAYIDYFKDGINIGEVLPIDRDGDGMITKEEAESICSLSARGDQLFGVFRGNTKIKTFNELQYFNGLKYNPLDTKDFNINCISFEGCTALTDVTLPDPYITKMTFIGKNFVGCTSLEKIKIREGYKKFKYTFQKNPNLKLVDLPSTTEYIESLFHHCTDKQHILICRAFVPPILNGWGYGGIPKIIYVPDISVDVYKQADVWKDYNTIIKPLSEYIPIE